MDYSARAVAGAVRPGHSAARIPPGPSPILLFPVSSMQLSRMQTSIRPGSSVLAPALPDQVVVRGCQKREAMGNPPTLRCMSPGPCEIFSSSFSPGNMGVKIVRVLRASVQKEKARRRVGAQARTASTRGLYLYVPCY